MEPIEYFKGTDAHERYNNALLNEIRKQNQLLEQLILLIQPQKVEPTKVIAPRRTQAPKTNTKKRVK